MKELRDILERVDRSAGGERAILATVVDVRGSGYRLAGARMLIDETGRRIGSVSGGCLESDVLERAKSVLKTGKPTIVVYDSTADDNSVFGLQMGCRGVVRILLEPADNRELFDHIRATFERRKASTVATLISANGKSAEYIGDRFYRQNGDVCGPVLPGVYDATVRPRLGEALDEALRERRSTMVNYTIEGDELEFFVEVIEPPISAVVFGAGHDAIPLVTFAKQLGWNVTVVDRRPLYATPSRFPDADNVIPAHAEDLDDQVFSEENGVAIVMTHHFESDREIVRRLVGSQVRYIGILGPKQRTADLLKQLSETGTEIGADFLARVHAPIGLDIGAATPESIALSIVAEIQSVLHGRDGGFLKHRTKPIYDR